MAVNRYYSNTAVDTTLSSGINNSVTSMTVGAVTGFPTSYPYTLVIDPGTGSEEVVSVTNAVGTTLTIVRGQDNTAATTHSAAAVVKHAVSARDFREPQEHIDSTAAHGATGAVVGTTNTQTLTNKTLTAPTLTAPVASGSLTGFGGAWTAFSPTLGSFGGDASIGSGSITARYLQIGKTVHAHIFIAGGASSTWGTGGGRLNNPFPVTPHASFLGVTMPVSVWSGSALTLLGALVISSTRIDFYSGGSGLTGTFTTSSYTIDLTYEAA